MSPRQVIEEAVRAADRAITREDFDALMAFYTDEAVLVVKPGTIARGKPQIRQAFGQIAEHFSHRLVVKQGAMQVLDAGDTALVIMETKLEIGNQDSLQHVTRRATYVFKQVEGNWLCSIDNSYGTDLLSAHMSERVISLSTPKQP